MNYFTKWVEAIPTKHATKEFVISFLENTIITRFGAPTKITTDNAKDFSSLALSNFFFNYGILLSHSSNYYPRGNVFIESSNKNLVKNIKKTVCDNKKNWDGKTRYALWVDKITTKKATSKTPFELIYGTKVKLLVNLKIHVYHLLQQFIMNQAVVQVRIDQQVEFGRI
jgi:transposase InsO family protein